MSLFSKPKYSTVVVKKKDIPKGLWTKCPISGEIVFNKELEANQMVVPKSGYHFGIGGRERLAALLDPGSFEELDLNVGTADPLDFVDSKSYAERIAGAKKSSGLNEALVSGMGEIHGIPISIAVMDFRFLVGSLGSAVGEKIARAAERSLEHKCPLIIVSASGGARMQEGIFSLMQMAKISAVLARLHEAKIPYISIMTHPTTGGVTASYATLGDINIAEPGAMICFAGPRVIKETTKQTLPPGFQTAEFLMQKGLIDQIVSRLEMRDRLGALLSALFTRKPTVVAPAKAG
jgi:acetyl-CoA carboxylase carboxyl transferase subunit beta